MSATTLHPFENALATSWRDGWRQSAMSAARCWNCAFTGMLVFPQKGFPVKDDRNPLAVYLGTTIRMHRVRLAITQEELARRTSLHRTEVGLIERGQREPRLGTIIKLAGALGAPLGSILTGIDWKVTEKAFVFTDRDDEHDK
jgi:DNA-binding XRE family transcriptional regulator